MKLRLFKKKKEKPKTPQEEYGFFGNYPSFEEVEKISDSYAKDDILSKTLESVLKVKNNEAVFERDSYIFDKIEYSWPLLASLLKVASDNNNTLRILDFGGALASHYFQNKSFLDTVNIEKWTVVEQKSCVDAGNKYIADDIVNFAYSIDDINDANVLIASSVIQYLKEPYDWTEKLINKNIKYIIIDRTAFTIDNTDRLTLQKVPPEIYSASYPAWFLNEERFLKLFENKYSLITDFDATIDKANIPSVYKGYLFKLKTNN